jgi:GMP synthase-like glutamine amidotransferase
MKQNIMNKLRIHYFQHAESEGLGSIEEWIIKGGHTLTSTEFYKDAVLPELSAIDWLIIMGGYMSVNDETKHPWLKGEKTFIRDAVAAGKTVLGICLGSQLVSAALGAKVYKNNENEIGWFDIEPTCYAKTSNLFFDMPERAKVFHWHGDTFDLPDGAVHLAYSKATKHQAYVYKERVLALQFHLEPTREWMNEMIDTGGDELIASSYVQTADEIIKHIDLVEPGKQFLFRILNRLAGFRE